MSQNATYQSLGTISSNKQHLSQGGTSHTILIQRSGSTPQTGGPSAGNSPTAQHLRPCARYRRPGYKQTKSGCMTYRRRKKKCDEAKPMCRYAISRQRQVLIINVGDNCRQNGVSCVTPATSSISKATLFSQFSAIAHATSLEQARNPLTSTIYQARSLKEANPVLEWQVANIKSSY